MRQVHRRYTLHADVLPSRIVSLLHYHKDLLILPASSAATETFNLETTPDSKDR